MRSPSRISAAAREWPGAGRPDASMTLLREVTEHPLDPGYAEAARRAADERAAEADGAGATAAARLRRCARQGLTLALALALGLAVTTAVSALRRPSEPGDREDLVSSLRQRSAQADAASARAVALRAGVQRLQDADLAGDPDAPTASAALLVASGTTVVTGPGLVIALRDAPGARATSASDPRNVDPDAQDLVQDVDLREVANGLWLAGAEAVAINGQRLTSATAIRSAGGAILVDFRPLTPPYRVAAIGSPNALDARFALTRAATYVQGLHEQYSIGVSVSSEDHLSLPALEGQQLFSAKVLRPSSSPSASASTTQEASP